MRRVLATAAGLLVLAATVPVLCASDEFGEESCKSSLMLPTVGTGEHAEVWTLLVCVPAAPRVPGRGTADPK